MAIFLIIALLIGAVFVHWYFHSRLDRAPSRSERVFALCWLILRRMFCAIGVVFGIAGAVFTVARFTSEGNGAAAVGGFLFFGFLTWLFAHYFLYGGGYFEHAFKEDKPIHEMRKKRYKWRW